MPPVSQPFEKRVLIGTLIVIGLVCLVFVVWHFSRVLLLLFASVLVAIFLNGLTTLVQERTRQGHGASLAIVLLVLLSVVGLGGVLLAPQVGAQIDDLREALPDSLSRFRDYVGTLPFGDRIVDELQQREVLNGDTLMSRVGGFFGTTLTMLAQFLFVVIVGVYLTIRPQTYIQGVLKLVPLGQRDRACEVLGAIGYTLQWWLVGQAIIMLTVGVSTWIGLALLGVPLALTLGIIAGLLDFVPNIGPIVAAIPGILIAFLAGPQQALYVLILYVVVQQIESYVLAPIVHKKTISLAPALTLTAQLGLALTVGFLGVLLATPLVATALVAIKMLYVEDVLGDSVEVDGRDDGERVCATDAE